MYGVAVRLTRTVPSGWLNNQPSSMAADCGEEGPIDRAVRAGTRTVCHNSVALVDGPPESVLEARGNAQPECLLRGVLAI
jgi:hypothetical protein